MKRILQTALIILIFVLSGKANAFVMDSTFLKAKIKQGVEAQIKSELNKDIKVEILSIPYQKIETSSENIEIKTLVNLKYFNAVTIIRVSILVDGAVYKSFTAQGKIDIGNNKNSMISKNSITERNFNKIKPVIIRDNTISVIFKADKVSITIPAVALNNGCIGDYIKVRSTDYKKHYQGKVIGENLVLVDI